MDISQQLTDLKQAVNALHRGAAKPPKYAAALLMAACAALARRAGNHVLANNLVQKAAVAPAMTTNLPWAGDMIASPAGQLILMSSARSAFASILARSHQVGVLGASQQAVTVLATPGPASIVGEGEAIPLTKGSLVGLPISAKKIAAIVSFTGEQAKRSTIVSVARMLLTESLGKGLDLLAFTDQPPFGLLQGLTPVAAGATALADVKNLIAAMPDASPDVTFTMNTARWPLFLEAVGPAFPYQSFPSSAVDLDTMISVDPQGLAGAASGGEIDASTESLLHESDMPTAIIAGSPTRSLWQTDTYALRGLLDLAFKARPGSVAYVSAVTW